MRPPDLLTIMTRMQHRGAAAAIFPVPRNSSHLHPTLQSRAGDRPTAPMLQCAMQAAKLYNGMRAGGEGYDRSIHGDPPWGLFAARSGPCLDPAYRPASCPQVGSILFSCEPASWALDPGSSNLKTTDGAALRCKKSAVRHKARHNTRVGSLGVQGRGTCQTFPVARCMPQVMRPHARTSR